MRINTIIVTVSLLYVITSYAQVSSNESLPPYIITSRNVNLVVEDTFISMSVLTEQTGRIHFENGYDFDNSTYSGIRIIGKGRTKVNYKDSIIVEGKENLNLVSYFPPLNQDSTKFINGYDFDFDWTPHYGYDVYYTYILHGVGASNLYKSNRDSVIRIVLPGPDIDKEIHDIYEVEINGSQIRIQYIKAVHTQIGKFNILVNDSCIVTEPKQIKAFKEQFEKFRFNEDSYFVRVDGSLSYLIEFKNKSEYYAFIRPYVDFYGRASDNKFPIILNELYQRNKQKK